MSNQNENGAGKREWRKPEIVEVGGVADITTFGDGNLRDNQGSDKVNYVPFTKKIGNQDDEVDLEGR